MHCTECGEQLEIGDRFCPKCSANILFNIDNNLQEKTKETIKDIPWIYLLFQWMLFTGLFYYFALHNYRDIFFNAGQTVGGLVLAIPIIVIVFIVQYIRKKPYFRPRLHLSIIWAVIELVALIGR